MYHQHPQYHTATSPEVHTLYIRVPTDDYPARGPHDTHHSQGQIHTNPGFAPPVYLDGQHSPKPTMPRPFSPDRGELTPEQPAVGYHYRSYPTPCPSTTRLVLSAYDGLTTPSARTSVVSVEDTPLCTPPVQPSIQRSYPEPSRGRATAFASQTSVATQDAGPYYPLEFEEDVHHGWCAAVVRIRK
jgi:hypothetical protein